MDQANSPEPSSWGELRAGIHPAAMQRLSDKSSAWWGIGQLAKLPKETTDLSFTQAQRPRGLCPRSVNFSSSNRAQFPGTGVPGAQVMPQNLAALLKLLGSTAVMSKPQFHG